jgi:hypothetical protein
MNGKFRFVALQPSGLVCAAEAIKGGLRAAVDEMIGGQLDAQTVVPINGTEEEEDALWAQLMERRQAAAAASGKKKKRGNPHPVSFPLRRPLQVNSLTQQVHSRV